MQRGMINIIKPSEVGRSLRMLSSRLLQLRLPGRAGIDGGFNRHANPHERERGLARRKGDFHRQTLHDFCEIASRVIGLDWRERGDLPICAP